MRAGLLRDSIVVKRADPNATDAVGNPTPGALTDLIAAQRARITPLGGDERVRADRLTGSVRYEVVLRWSAANAGIAASDVFVLARASAGLAEGTQLNVRHSGVDPTEKRRELRFICEAGVAV